jgi:hypothetical protein
MGLCQWMRQFEVFVYVAQHTMKKMVLKVWMVDFLESDAFGHHLNDEDDDLQVGKEYA